VTGWSSPHPSPAVRHPSDLYVCQIDLVNSAMSAHAWRFLESWNLWSRLPTADRQMSYLLLLTDLAPLLASLPLSATCRVHSREDRMIHHEQNSYTRDRSKETAATFLGILTKNTNTYLHRCACQIVQYSGAPPSGRAGSNSWGNGS
jgi:hypothetical protein